VRSDIREIRQLASAQDEMRGMLKASHDELTEEHRALLEAQEKLIQAAKMESVGRLAAGVAHEVKNPLAIVQLGVDYLRDGRDLDDTTRQVLGDMENAVTRADRVIKGLLDFSREHQLDLRPSELNQVIRESLHLVEHEINQHGIRVELNLRSIPQLELDADKLRQVFVNLFMNAVQAMGTAGTLSISSAEVVLNEPEQLRRFAAGGFVAGDLVAYVEVSDTGPGISKAQQSHLFEPFFTTKAVGDGTGLGLSVSKTIVELHRGAIDIANREPRGASVVLVFPINQPSGGSDEQD
jgi:signal transduction histidine kinase